MGDWERNLSFISYERATSEQYSLPLCMSEPVWSKPELQTHNFTRSDHNLREDAAVSRSQMFVDVVEQRGSKPFIHSSVLSWD